MTVGAAVSKSAVSPIAVPINKFLLLFFAMLKSCVAKYGQTLVMITHDETIAQMADRTLIIEDGKVVG